MQEVTSVNNLQKKVNTALKKIQVEVPFDCICLYSLNSQNSVINCLVFLNCVLSIRYKCFILRQSSRTGIMNYLCTFGFTDAAFITEAPYLKEKSVTIKTPKHSRRGKGNNQLKSVPSLGLYALKKTIWKFRKK